MSAQLDSETIQTIKQYNGEQRYKYLLKTVNQQQQIWILTDDDGCVMLNTEDEDCVPVWPQREFAEAWANGEWQDCKPKAIALKKWFADWTDGLLQDDLAIVVFPNQQDEGLVVYPDELELALKNKMR